MEQLYLFIFRNGAGLDPFLFLFLGHIVWAVDINKKKEPFDKLDFLAVRFDSRTDNPGGYTLKNILLSHAAILLHYSI